MKTKISLDLVLKENSTYARHALKFRLIDEKIIKYECAECKNDGVWEGKYLSLHLDHINGVFNDNRIENLRFLCPNCHAQTDSYAGKNIIGKKNVGTAKNDYRYVKREKDRERWLQIKNDPSINFDKRGWVQKVSEMLQITPQKVGKWIMRVDTDFYNQKYKGE